VELHEATNLVEMAVARDPNLLEGSLAALGDLESVHGDKHLMSPGFDCDGSYHFSS